MATDPYATLEIAPDASDGVVKAAYRRLAALYHPDRNPGFQAAATERLRDINAAFELIRAARLGVCDTDGDPAAPPPEAQQRRDRKSPAGVASRRAATKATLRRLGFLSAAPSSSDDIVIEFLVSVLPDESEIVSCMRYSELRSNRPDASSDVSRRFLRPLPPPLRPTRIVLLTQHRLLWSTGAVAASDGVVVEERVTAHSVRLNAIRGAEVRRKGLVEISVDDGAALTFRMTRERASELGSCLERVI